jgi:antitoxin VapB
MKTMAERYRAKLFRNGGSQAVRLPKSFRFRGNEVMIWREGDCVILEPARSRWSDAFIALVQGAPDETIPARHQPKRAEVREDLEP